MKQIKIACDAPLKLEISQLNYFQGELKSLSKQNYAKLRDEIVNTGFAFPIYVWFDEEEKKYWILGGHQRYRTVKQMIEQEGFEPITIPCTPIHAANKKEARRRILQDVSQYGKIDDVGLYEFATLAEMEFEDLKAFDLPEINLNAFEKEFYKDEVVEGQDDIPELAPRRANPGDLFQLGNHRLLCGDSTKKEDVEKLMGGEIADICFTSPPYNLGENAKLRGTNASGDDSAYEEGADDHKTQEDYLSFLGMWTTLALNHSKVVFSNIQMLAGNKLIMPDYWQAFKNNLVDIMIWDKGHGAPAMAPRVLNSVWEFIFILSNENKPKRSIKTGPEFRGTLENIFRLNPVGKKDAIQSTHGAVFPVQFPQHFIKHFSQNSVLDLFGGTGSTMIACENMNRKCYTMELSPTYCDIIITRWEKFSGQKATLFSYPQ